MFDRKEYYKGYSKKYYEEHKTQKLEYARKLRRCKECNKDIKNNSYRLHLQSSKHKLNEQLYNLLNKEKIETKKDIDLVEVKKE